MAIQVKVMSLFLVLILFQISKLLNLPKNLSEQDQSQLKDLSDLQVAQEFQDKFRPLDTHQNLPMSHKPLQLQTQSLHL